MASAAERLPDLADVGVTTIEMMPVAEFAGRVGWGYDGVAFFAPYHHYGTPDDLRAFVDRAHALGLAVRPRRRLQPLRARRLRTGARSRRTTRATRYRTDWGTPPNFDGEHAGPVREFFVANARYWIDEFHFDGLRLDATQDVEGRQHAAHPRGDRRRRARGRTRPRTRS